MPPTGKERHVTPEHKTPRPLSRELNLALGWAYDSMVDAVGLSHSLPDPADAEEIQKIAIRLLTLLQKINPSASHIIPIDQWNTTTERN